MYLRKVISFLSVLLLLNSIAIDYLLISFYPSKNEVEKQFKEHVVSQVLEYPCQFDDCGCTKESCLTACCCKVNHEVFGELASSKVDSSNILGQPTSIVEVVIKKPISFIKHLICKKDKLKDNEQIMQKREPFILVKTHLAILSNVKEFVVIVLACAYMGIQTQVIYTPENPPPDIA